MNEPKEITRADVQVMLNEYDDITAAMDVLRMDAQKAKDAVLPAEIKEQLEAIDAEIVDKLSAATKNAEALKSKIKQSLLSLPDEERTTIRGMYNMAVVKNASDTIDYEAIMRGLTNLSEKYPAIAGEISDLIAVCTKRGTQSVAIQKA